MRRIALLAVVLGATFTAASVAAPTKAPSRRVRLQQALDNVVKAGVPGALVLVRNGGTTLRLASGYADVRTKTRLRPGDRFRAGSVTKTFIAAAILRLVGEGTLSLDDTVERWLPGLVPNGGAITVRRLLNMTSGLFDYLNDGDDTVVKRVLGPAPKPFTPEELVAISTSHPPLFAPGAAWHYCNTCYVLLGLIAQKATGQPIAAVVNTRVLARARVLSTYLATSASITGRHAHGYEHDGKSLSDVTNIEQSWAWSAGNLVSTAGDLARFYRVLLGGGLLQPALLRQMETTVGAGAGTGYGFGLVKQSIGCGATWGHTGDTPGYQTRVFNSKDGKHQAVVAYMLGDDPPSAKIDRAVSRLLATAYCG
jgi:D-alanyl-D-alanine carboxypeptidase